MRKYTYTHQGLQPGDAQRNLSTARANPASITCAAPGVFTAGVLFPIAIASKDPIPAGGTVEIIIEPNETCVPRYLIASDNDNADIVLNDVAVEGNSVGSRGTSDSEQIPMYPFPASYSYESMRAGANPFPGAQCPPIGKQNQLRLSVTNKGAGPLQFVAILYAVALGKSA